MNNLTVLTACKDREKNLNLMRRNVAQLNTVSKHLVIDWSSEEKINLENENNVEVILKKNEKNYWASRAYNFGVNAVDTDYILKIDTDTILNSDKFNNLIYHNYDLIIFYKEKYDPGNFLVKKDLFKKVNGFNEYIYGWGWEDHDLINRLKKIIDPNRVLELTDYIDKIKHKDSERVNIKDSELLISQSTNYSYGIKKAFNQTNSYISSLNIWNNQTLKYNNLNNEIGHFYSVEQLSLTIRLKNKYYFFNTLFMVLKPERRFYRRLAPYFFCFYKKESIIKKFGVEIYPSN